MSESKNISIYLNEENLSVLDTLATSAGGRSQAIAKLIEAQKPTSTECKTSVDIVWAWSEKHKREDEAAGRKVRYNETKKIYTPITNEIADVSTRHDWGERMISLQTTQDVEPTIEDAIRIKQEEIMAELAEKAQREQDAKKYKDKIEKENQEREEKERARIKAVNDNVESLKKWSLETGSELLKARIDGGFMWQDLAHDEYGESLFANSPLPVSVLGGDDTTTYKTPSLGEIQMFNTFKTWLSKHVPGATCAMVITKDDGDILGHEIHVTYPNFGDTYHQYFTLPAEEQE